MNVFSQDSLRVKENGALLNQADSLQKIIDRQNLSLRELVKWKDSIATQLKEHRLNEDYFQTALQNESNQFSTMVNILGLWFGVLVTVILGSIALFSYFNIETRFKRIKDEYQADKDIIQKNLLNAAEENHKILGDKLQGDLSISTKTSKEEILKIIDSEWVKQNARFEKAEENFQALGEKLQNELKSFMIGSREESLKTIESQWNKQNDRFEKTEENYRTLADRLQKDLKLSIDESEEKVLNALESRLQKSEKEHQSLNDRIDNSNGNLFALFHQFYNDREDWTGALISAIKAASAFSEAEKHESQLIFDKTIGNLRHARFYFQKVGPNDHTEIPYQSELIRDLRAIRFTGRDNKDVGTICRRLETDLENYRN